MGKNDKSVAALILLCVLAYANSLWNGFAFDDYAVYLDNDNLHLPFWKMLQAPYTFDQFWRPVAQVFSVVNMAISGYRPMPAHAINLVMHIGVVLLLYALLRELLGNRPAVFAAAALFAVHPLHTEAVTAVHGRIELLAAGFVLAAWLLHVRGRTLAACACFLLALGSKESAICFIWIVPIADWLMDRKFNRLTYWSYAAVVGIYLTLRWKTVGLLALGTLSYANNPLATLSPPLRIANALYLAWMMLGLHVFPWKLSVEHSYNAIPVLFDWRVLTGWVAATIAVLAAWLYFGFVRHAKALLLAGWIYMAGFALTSNILFHGPTNFGERWAYLPSAGFCLAAGLAYEQLESRRRSVAVIVLITVLAAMTARTMVRNRDWQNDFTLAVATVNAYPSCIKALYYLGWQYVGRGDYARGEPLLLKAEQIYPDDLVLQQGLGSSALRRKDYAAAEPHFRRALRLSAGRWMEPEVVITYASLFVESGNYHKAYVILNSAIVSWPGYTRAYSNRALLFYRVHRNEQARADAETALRLNPNNTQARNLLTALH